MPRAAMTGRVARFYDILLWLAFAWALGNALYVYLLRHGGESFRLESAIFVLVALSLPRLFTSPHPEPPRSRSTPLDDRVLLLAALALWLYVMLPLLRVPFLSDDYGFLDVYAERGDVLRPIQYFRPAFAVIFMLLARVGHSSAAVFHVASLLAHLLATALVYALALRLFKSRTHATMAAVFFLLSPIQLEPVLWASGLQDVLWTTCALGALYVYTTRDVLSWPAIAGTALLTAGALASKETAVCLIALLPAADWLLHRGRRGRLLVPAYVTFAGILIVYFLIRRRFVRVDAGFLTAPSQFLLKQLLAVPYKMFAQPWGVDTVTMATIVSCVVAVALVALLFARVQARDGEVSRLLVGPAMILASTLPLYSYFAVYPNLRHSRYLYFAAAGYAVFIGELLTPVLRTRWRAPAMLVLAVALAMVLSLNARAWRNAADLIAVMRDDIAAGGDGRLAVATWKDGHDVALQLKDGLPIELQGIDVMTNGYPEFVALVRRNAVGGAP